MFLFNKLNIVFKAMESVEEWLYEAHTLIKM